MSPGWLWEQPVRPATQRDEGTAYHRIFAALRSGIWVLDRDGCTTYVNPYLLEKLGYGAAEMRGRPLAAFLDTHDPEAGPQDWGPGSRDPCEPEAIRLVCQDGSRILVSLSLSPLLGPDGCLEGTVAAVQDITARRQRLEALQTSERLLHESQRIAQLGGWEMDLESGRIDCTDETYRIHDLPADHVGTLEHALSFYAPEDRVTLEGAMRRGIETGEPWDLELPFTSAAGRHLWVRAKGRVEFQDGRAVKLSGIFQDISQQKEAEATQALLASIVESSGEAIVSTTLDGTILTWNPGAERTFGYPAEQTLGHRITHISPPDLGESIRQMLEEVAAGSQIEYNQMAVRRNDGLPIDVSVTMSPIRDGKGRIDRIALIVSDITSLKQAECAIREAKGRLEISVQERTRDLLWVNEELLALAQAEREERRVAELLTLASLALSQTLSMETLLETLLDFLAQLVPYDSAEVLLWQSPTHLAIPAIRGYEEQGDPRDFSDATLAARANPFVDRVLGEQTSLLIADTQVHPDWQHPLAAEHARGWLAVPLKAGDQVIGLCGLSTIQPGFFTRQHVRLAEALAGQAAVAVQNAWLFEQIRAGRERLQALARGLVEVQETERRYVARELHDEAGQALSSLMVGLGLLEREAHRPEAVLSGIDELRHIAEGVMEDLHRLAMDLRPSSLDRLGLVAAISQHLQEVSEKHGLAVQLETAGLDERLSPEVETALYRIMQEAVTNVIRHAQATRVNVLLETRCGKLCMIIEDNGTGFDPGAIRNHGRLGLFGIRERVEMLGGKLAVESTPGAGTALWLEIPHAGPRSPGR